MYSVTRASCTTHVAFESLVAITAWKPRDCRLGTETSRFKPNPGCHYVPQSTYRCDAVDGDYSEVGSCCDRRSESQPDRYRVPPHDAVSDNPSRIASIVVSWRRLNCLSDRRLLTYPFKSRCIQYMHLNQADWKRKQIIAYCSGDKKQRRQIGRTAPVVISERDR